MKKLIAALVLIAGCRTVTTTLPPATSTSPEPRGANVLGAQSPVGAVQSFLAAAKAQDLQAMSAIWGSQSGAVRDQIPRDELEKRELIIMCYTKHDSARVVTEGQAAAGGKRVFVVQLMLGDLTRSTNFTAVEGPSGRWYVESLDLEPLSAFCAKGGGD